MSARLIAVLAVLTVITTAAAVVVAIERTQETGVRTVDLPAFPALRERPDDVVRVTIRAEGGTIELERAAPDRWVTPDRAGYPVELFERRAAVGARPRGRSASPASRSRTRTPRTRAPGWCGSRMPTARCSPRSSSASGAIA